jgi:hypothetical protein
MKMKTVREMTQDELAFALKDMIRRGHEKIATITDRQFRFDLESEFEARVGRPGPPRSLKN